MAKSKVIRVSKAVLLSKRALRIYKTILDEGKYVMTNADEMTDAEERAIQELYDAKLVDLDDNDTSVLRKAGTQKK
jgi:hypothetical protein